MHSSTFNSSDGYPQGPWLKTWLTAVVLAATLLLAWEAALRGLGHRPTVVDDMALWAHERDHVYGNCCDKTVVLLGDCRMQLGIVPQVLAERFPGHRVVQLAMEQTGPVAALRDLAADKGFNGVVVCAINARELCKDMWDTQQPLIDYYHTHYSLNERLNRLVSTALQQRLVVLHPQLRLDDVIIPLIQSRRLPAPYYIETHPDRSRLADYSGVDVEAHRRWALARERWLCGKEQPTSDKWLEDAMETETWVRAIQARGGQVIFVQLPTTGDHLRYDEWIFPKAQYWDAFASRTSALCIHFQDVPQLSDFDCPDSSHIDRADAPRFTLELAEVMKDRGLFRESCCAMASERSGKGEPRCLCRNHDRCRPEGLRPEPTTQDMLQTKEVATASATHCAAGYCAST